MPSVARGYLYSSSGDGAKCSLVAPTTRKRRQDTSSAATDNSPRDNQSRAYPRCGASGAGAYAELVVLAAGAFAGGGKGGSGGGSLLGSGGWKSPLCLGVLASCTAPASSDASAATTSSTFPASSSPWSRCSARCRASLDVNRATALCVGSRLSVPGSRLLDTPVFVVTSTPWQMSEHM